MAPEEITMNKYIGFLEPGTTENEVRTWEAMLKETDASSGVTLAQDGTSLIVECTRERSGEVFKLLEDTPFLVDCVKILAANNKDQDLPGECHMLNPDYAAFIRLRMSGINSPIPADSAEERSSSPTTTEPL